MPRAALVAAPVAVLATISAVTFGVVAQEPTQARDLMAHSEVPEAGAAVREPVVSRARSRMAARSQQQERQQERRQQAREEARRERQREQRQAEREARATRAAVRGADTRLWTTEDLNLWTTSSRDAVNTGLLEAGKRVLVTGRSRDGRDEVVVGGESRWVTSGYLDEEKPEKPEKEVAGIGGQCTNGSSVPSGVDPDIAKVHQAVCAAFPDVTSYGTFRSDGEHAQGRAVDIMVSGERGWEVAEFVRANYVALGVEYLIYAQKIWSVERGGEGWRGMSDRGSATANHYDHVHVTVY